MMQIKCPQYVLFCHAKSRICPTLGSQKNACTKLVHMVNFQNWFVRCLNELRPIPKKCPQFVLLETPYSYLTLVVYNNNSEANEKQFF